MIEAEASFHVHVINQERLRIKGLSVLLRNKPKKSRKEAVKIRAINRKNTNVRGGLTKPNTGHFRKCFIDTSL
jgi:hypothetical protein